MMRNWQFLFFLCCLSSLASLSCGAEKWSRQLEPGRQSDGDSSLDWIPLAQPVEGAGGSSKDRSENGRVLTYSQTFPPNARFGEFPKSQSAPLQQHQAFQDFPYQFQRYPNGPLKSSNIQQQEPTSQSFFKFEMPFHHEGGRLPGAPPSLQTGYQIQHSFNGGQGQATLYSSQLYNQQPLYNDNYQHLPQKSLQAQPLLRKPSIPQQNYIDESLPIKSPFRETKPSSALPNLSPQAFPLHPKHESVFEVNKPSSIINQQQYQPGPAANAAPQEEVQLVYVPYDTYLNRQQQQQQQQHQNQHSTLDDNPGFELNRFNLNPGLPAVNPYQINQFYTQDPIGSQQQNYFTSSTTSRPKTTSTNPSNIFQNFVTPQFTTPKPKPKAHQPPLAMFLMRKSARPSQSDVVTTLRNSETIAVIDAPTKEAPNVFVGPAGMPIPDGYVKFDLPYLSQLSQTRTLNDVPFFVAPLSYRTPNGFNKILLPEPHVGSIVVNRAKDNSAVASQATFTPSQSTNEYPATTQHTRLHSQRVKQPTSSKDTYPEILREPNTRNHPQFEVTTQRNTIPTRGHKFSYYIDQVEEAHPKIKQNRPKKKRPQSVQIEQPDYTQIQSNQYEPFNAIPNEDYYKIQTSKAPASTSTSSTSTSTTSTSTTTSTTTPAPSTYFPYNSSPQIEFHSSNGQLYPSYNTVASSQTPEHTPRFTTRPPPTTAEEEHRMKQYFRQQDAFRNRPHTNNPTYSPFEQVQYTPIEVSIPSSTMKPGKQRFTFYTPMDTTSSPNIYNTFAPQETSDKSLPQNHRPSYNPNEISDSNVEYEPNPYQLPSELPPLTPNLPGQVNDLQENKVNTQSAQETTTPTQYEVETQTRPTRRPINRTRKPLVSKVTSSVSYSETETSGKRVTNRLRRPYGTRGNSNVDENSETGEESATTTRRPSSSTRNTSLRNPNRIRYQPTPEERQSLRIKPKKVYKGSNKGTPAEDLEYQRDVLKQNYPVFRPGSSSSSSSSRKTTSPTAIPSSYAVTSTEGATSETQQVYTVTPSNNEQVFPAGMLEPMQIAQQYNQYSKENYGPGYFPNQEDLNPTEPVRNEVNPVYTASTMPSTTTKSPTTIEASETTTRRSLFVRRNYPRLKPTTTEIPATTTLAPEEKTTIRSRIPPRKVIKVRTRNRRPLHPASSTANTPEEESEPEPVKNSYRKLNRFNQDLYERDTPKRRYKTQFHLEGQESQWSPSVNEDGKDNFSPIELKDTSKNTHDFENEPEIVTIGPESRQTDSETYEISVSADYDSKKKNSSYRGPNLKPEKSFAELLEEVMGKVPDERPLSEESTSTTRTTDGTYFESQKTTIGNLINRRGKWKKVRAQSATAQNDSFEAAESQNIGEQLLNKIYEDREKLVDKLKTTTPLTPALQTSTPVTSVTEYSTVNNLESFATIQPDTTTPSLMDKQKFTTISPETTAQEATHESATRRLDMDVGTAKTPVEDLDSQPSIFSEVKRQLHDLFAIDDTEDHAVTAALAAVKRNKEYTSIKRTRPPPTTTDVSPTNDITATAKTPSESIIGSTTPSATFHKNLMDHLVYSTRTSTDTKVSSETEICYRGRCIRSEDLPSNHKLQ